MISVTYDLNYNKSQKEVKISNKEHAKHFM